MAWKLIAVALLLHIATAQKCALITNGLGYTSPSGDILIHHKVDDLDLECIINKPEVLRKYPNTANDWLQFKHGNSLLNFTKVAGDGARIHLHVDADKLEVNETCPTYSCLWRSEIVCDNVVCVGTPPKPKDFKCISYNNDNFTCTWTHPENGIKPTIYNVSYTVQSQRQKVTPCPHTPIYNMADRSYKCVWTLTSTPSYRQSSEYYNITLTASNKLGDYRINLPVFHHFAHIIPNKPEGLEVVNSTTSSLYLRWGIPATIQHRTLQYRVMYQCGLEMPERVRDGTFKQAIIDTVSEKSSWTFNLTNLPHPHDLCDVRVSLRINLTRDEGMWSQNATLYTLTAPTVPGQGPQVDMGSFKHINDTAVRIYWHLVPAEFHNGPKLEYDVRVVRGAGNVIIDRTRQMKNSAVIGNLSSNQNYTFAVYARNEIGPQITPHAHITIPAQYQRPYQVRELKKIENTKGFKLSWKPRFPDNENPIVNYTVFWCREITKSFNEDCNGDWEWATVPRDQNESKYEYNTSLNVNSTTSFRVAIASNSERGSSGMFFPTCEESGEQIPSINLIKPTQFGDTSVKLNWMVKCTTEGIANYTIEYCIGDQVSHDCRSKKRSSVNVDGSVTEFTIGNLTPYATYLFTIYPTMKNGNKGKTSDPERVTTMEGKPTEPLDLIATKVTNTSIALEWKKPETANGFISYDILNNSVRVASNIKDTNYSLEGLTSYDLYNLTVVACTSNKCSNPSNCISLRTLMGTPGRVKAPTAKSINTTDIFIVWSKPTDPRGPVTYEVLVDDGEVNTFTNKLELYHYKCVQKSTSFTLTVRAVNHDEDLNKTYYGDWSDEFKGSCSPSMGWLIPLLIVLSFLLVGLAYFSKRLYTRCKKMQDIDVKLPSTLIMHKDTSAWPSQNDPNIRDPKPPSAADEELLLQSRPEGLKTPYVGDSSGCSSAQGSVTSESEGTFSAASDSGTEQSELRKRSFRNSSKTSLLGAECGGTGKNESYSQVGMNMGIESNPLAEMDDVIPKPSLCTYMQPYVDANPVVNRPPETANSSYVTVAQARSLPKPKEEAITVNKPYVQVADIKSVGMKREPPQVDANRSYVTVGQMPQMKLFKED